MDTNPLRIAKLVSTLAVAAVVVGCASAPPPQPAAPEPAPVVEQPVTPPPLVLKPNYPERYVVVKGDTLWDISTRFLEDPWRWPELWQNNPQIANPHLIYPGDVLTLIYVDGKPVIQVHRRPGEPTGLPEVRLSPEVRVEDLNRAIPTIPIDAIRQFLSRPRVVTQKELEDAPYIISSADKHLIAGPGNTIYVRGLKNEQQVEYVVVRPGQVYRNPADPEDILGYEAIHVADARLKAFGDPSTLQIKEANREVLNGDRLMPANDTLPDTSFMPRAPEAPVRGQIIAVPGGVSQIGQYQVVAINLGREQKMEPGIVLAVHQAGEMMRDRMHDNELVKMPDERAGMMMVFRVFDRVSYGLVMSATRPMHVHDYVTQP